MAKRKRLPPANPNFLGADPVDSPASGAPLQPILSPSRPRPPIAQVAGEASTAAALNELTDAMNAARAEGRFIQPLTLGQIDLGHLVRDRLVAEEEDLLALIESLRKRGQQTPIEVVDRGPQASPRYGLISGWRRMAALARLAAEDAAFDRVLALVRVPQNASEAYVAMVEENEIRVGLSYYERARIAVQAVEQGIYVDLKTALNDLFANVSRAKRSKIKSFTTLVDALEGELRFPTTIGERLGLDLAKRLEGDAALGAQLRQCLAASAPQSAESEQRILAAPAATTEARRSKVVEKNADSPVGSTPRASASSARVDITHDTAHRTLTLSGPGIDAPFRKALEAWLKAG